MHIIRKRIFTFLAIPVFTAMTIFTGYSGFYFPKQANKTVVVQDLNSSLLTLTSVDSEAQIDLTPAAVQAPSTPAPVSTESAPTPVAAPAPPVVPAQRGQSPSKASTPPARNTSLGVSPIIGNYSQDDLYWLAKMIYAEASAETYAGQVAVAAVILHRVASPNYPNSIKEVEYQVIDGHYQFTPIANGYINKVEPNTTSYNAAKDALNGVDPSKGALLYYNPQTSTNKWILSRPITVVIGNHIFAK